MPSNCQQHQPSKSFCPTCGKANLEVLRSISNNVGPRVVAKPGSNARFNRWEAGVPKDEKGLPYLDENLSPITQKPWSEKYRRKFQQAGLA